MMAPGSVSRIISTISSWCCNAGESSARAAVLAEAARSAPSACSVLPARAASSASSPAQIRPDCDGRRMARQLLGIDVDADEVFRQVETAVSRTCRSRSVRARCRPRSPDRRRRLVCAQPSRLGLAGTASGCACSSPRALAVSTTGASSVSASRWSAVPADFAPPPARITGRVALPASAAAIAISPASGAGGAALASFGDRPSAGSVMTSVGTSIWTGPGRRWRTAQRRRPARRAVPRAW